MIEGQSRVKHLRRRLYGHYTLAILISTGLFIAGIVAIILYYDLVSLVEGERSLYSKSSLFKWVGILFVIMGPLCVYIFSKNLFRYFFIIKNGKPANFTAKLYVTKDMDSTTYAVHLFDILGEKPQTAHYITYLEHGLAQSELYVSKDQFPITVYTHPKAKRLMIFEVDDELWYGYSLESLADLQN